MMGKKKNIEEDEKRAQSSCVIECMLRQRIDR